MDRFEQSLNQALAQADVTALRQTNTQTRNSSGYPKLSADDWLADIDRRITRLEKRLGIIKRRIK